MWWEENSPCFTTALALAAQPLAQIIWRLPYSMLQVQTGLSNAKVTQQEEDVGEEDAYPHSANLELFPPPVQGQMVPASGWSQLASSMRKEERSPGVVKMPPHPQLGLVTEQALGKALEALTELHRVLEAGISSTAASPSQLGDACSFLCHPVQSQCPKALQEQRLWLTK